MSPWKLIGVCLLLFAFVWLVVHWIPHPHHCGPQAMFYLNGTVPPCADVR